MNPPLTIEFLENTVPSNAWVEVPIWVMDHVGTLRPAHSARYQEDTAGNKVVILSTEPAVPKIRP